MRVPASNLYHYTVDNMLEEGSLLVLYYTIVSG